MASLPQILRDIHDLKLDPKVAHRTTGVSGRLKSPTKTPEAKVTANKVHKPEPQKLEPPEPNKYVPSQEMDPYVATETEPEPYEATKPLDDEELETALSVLEDEAPSHRSNPSETKHTKKPGKKDRS